MLSSGDESEPQEPLRRRSLRIADGLYWSIQRLSVSLRQRWVPLVIFGALTLLLLAIFVLPPQLAPSDAFKDRSEAIGVQNDVRTTLLQALGGLAVLTGVFFTYRQVLTGRDQLEVARQGQVTERFTRAIDQLGHEGQDVRIGGIYALERIARDSPGDRATIEEVLTAFIRGHAPWPPPEESPYPDAAPLQDLPQLQRRAADVQAALTVLGRRQIEPNAVRRLDLSNADLRKAALAHAHLEGANLGGTHLEGAILVGAHLNDAYLYEADLEEANLEDACLKRARLNDASLIKAQLHRANLKEALLDQAIMEEANLIGANLQGALLSFAILRNAHLVGANLKEAHLGNARLSGANLLAAKLAGAKVNNATTWPEGFNWQREEVDDKGDASSLSF